VAERRLQSLFHQEKLVAGLPPIPTASRGHCSDVLPGVALSVQPCISSGERAGQVPVIEGKQNGYAGQ
jgi:hypothetical protein